MRMTLSFAALLPLLITYRPVGDDATFPVPGGVRGYHAAPIVVVGDSLPGTMSTCCGVPGGRYLITDGIAWQSVTAERNGWITFRTVGARQYTVAMTSRTSVPVEPVVSKRGGGCGL